MMLALADGRPAHLTRVHQALTSLPEDEQRRLGVLADWRHGPHLLTYRQAEHTFGLVPGALGKDEPDGLPSAGTAARLRRPAGSQHPGPVQGRQPLAGRRLDATWSPSPGPRRAGPATAPTPRPPGGTARTTCPDEDELFFGYYLSAAVMVPDEHGPPVPELARRMTLSSCRHDPVPAFTPVLTAMPAAGIPLGDILADSGYSHRDPGALGHPRSARPAPSSSRTCTPTTAAPGAPTRARSSPTGTSTARPRPAPCWNSGRWPAPPPRRRPRQHDAKTAEAARYKLGRLTGDDADGYHRASAPPPRARSAARSGRQSMTLDRGRPEILTPPRAPAGLLHPADHHRPARRRRQDPAEARLPLSRLAALLYPAHRRRARLRHRQGPRQPTTSAAAGAASWA